MSLPRQPLKKIIGYCSKEAGELEKALEDDFGDDFGRFQRVGNKNGGLKFHLNFHGGENRLWKTCFLHE